jgi:hypothetical protein
MCRTFGGSPCADSVRVDNGLAEDHPFLNSTECEAYSDAHKRSSSMKDFEWNDSVTMS